MWPIRPRHVNRESGTPGDSGEKSPRLRYLSDRMSEKTAGKPQKLSAGNAACDVERWAANSSEWAGCAWRGRFSAK